MRKIIFSLSVSVDGFFEGPDGEIDCTSWTTSSTST